MLCAVVVLSMSKTAFLGFGILLIYFLIKGSRSQRREYLQATGLILCFLYLYRFFFPGLFAHNLGESTIRYSLFVRLNDIVNSLPAGNVLRELSEPVLAGTIRSVHLTASEHLSGIPIFIKYLPYLLPVLILLMIIFFRWTKRLRVHFPNLASMCIPVLLGLVIYPGTFPIWDTGLYWFMMSFALLPIFYKYFPRYFINQKRVSWRTRDGSLSPKMYRLDRCEFSS